MPPDLSMRQTALAAALDPAAVSIDARDARDRFAFVAQFARLILYYDQNNQAAGDWQAFFLKDPTLLLAAISACNYLEYQATYEGIQAQYQAAKKQNISRAHIDFVNQCADLMQHMFVHLNRWLQFMKRNAGNHVLQQFLQKSIRETLAQHLYQLIHTQQFLNFVNADYLAPETAIYREFDPLWHDSARVSDSTSMGDDATAQLEQCYVTVFNVFVQIIDSAKTFFYQIENWTTTYPDIGLLMSFVTLMQNQQTMINGYARQHLDFYYQQVLQLQPRPAQADEAYVCFTLADQVGSYCLPAATAFVAGNYADQTPVLFSSVKDFTINAVSIAQAVGVYADTLNHTGLYRQSNAQPSTVQTNQLQEVQSWPAFANDRGQGQGSKSQQGFAFASPMLYMQGGSRTLTVTLELLPSATAATAATAGTAPDYAAMFAHSHCFLSTESAWFAVSSYTSQQTASSTTLVLTIKLQNGDPPIVAFKQNPDGYTSLWPLLKIVLADDASLLAPPALKSVKFNTDIEGLTQLSLANDLTPMANGVATQTFGPLPEMGSCFYVGSNELFAKPLTTVDIQLNWDSLEDNFSQYYSAYNDYVLSQPSTILIPAPFANQKFLGEWRLLSEKLLSNKKAFWTSGSVTLFQKDTTSSGNTAAWGKNAQNSVFTLSLSGYAGFSAQPALCLSPLPNPAQTANGYFYFELENPKEGFGQSLYPKVVSNVVLKNALTLIEKSKPPNDSWVSMIVSAVQALVSGLLNGIKKLLKMLVGGLYSMLSGLLALIKAWIGKLGSGLGALATKLLALFKKGIKPAAPAKAAAPDNPPNPLAASVTPVAAVAPAADSAPVTVDGLLPMPNVPYSPKQSAVLVNYSACAQIDIATTAPADDSAYPCELYHYGVFQAYQVYTSGNDNTTPQLGFKRLCPLADSTQTKSAAPALPLLTGVSSPACLYLALGSVQAPCTLSIYAEVAELDNASDDSGADKQTVSYSYWGEQGWQAITVLQDETQNLCRSGIIQIAIPGLPASAQTAPATATYLNAPMLPGTDFWLAIAVPPAASVNLLATRLVFLGTQALRLQRGEMAGLSSGEVPWIAANSITGPKSKIAQITQIRQPFASFGGLAAENTTQFGGGSSFYRRVSQRLFDKDRACTVQDLIDMTHEACGDVFHVQRLKPNGARLRFGVIRGYPNAYIEGAYRPVLSALAIDQIAQHINQRAPGFTRLELINLPQQEVKIAVHLLVADANSQQALAEQINQQLRLYLSPWISSDVETMPIAQGINRAALTDFLMAQTGVLALTSLSILLRQADGKWQRSPLDPVLPSLPEAILISAAQHDIAFDKAIAAPVAKGGIATGKAAGQAMETSHVG